MKVFCLFTPFVSVFFVFHGKSLLHQIDRHTTSTSESFFEKKRHYGKYFFDIAVYITIQCNTDSCCEHIAGGVYIYLYGCVSLLVPDCAMYLCVCDIKSEYQQKTTSHTTVNLMACCIKYSKVALVLRYQGATF